MVSDRFIELLTDKLSDEISADDLQEFNMFLNEDPDCRQHYNLFKTYWEKNPEEYFNSDLMFRKIESKINVDVAGPVVNNFEAANTNRFKVWLKVAAVFVAGTFLSLAAYFYNYKTSIKPAASLEVVKTPSRIKSKITLSDGSVVTLNSETSLRYPANFSGPNREVYLNGEAFFDVAKDHAHPFIVHTGKMNIRVLGTAFDVKSYLKDASSETTLIRGAIEVTLSDRPSDRIILKPHDKLILKNGTYKTYHKYKRANVIIPDSVSTNYALTNLTYLRSNDSTIIETSWVNNKLTFKEENFSDLAAMMERWYGVKIKFKNDEAKDYRFTGIFEKESITEALDALQLIEKFNYKLKKETVTIY
jgi:transmembrane sensor